METKICSQCREEKSISGFYSYWKGRKGLTARCKECIKDKNSEYYARTKQRYSKQRAKYRATHREEYREREKQRYAKLRQEILEVYGFQCACCGETERLFLELDHIENNGKGVAGKALYTQVKLEGFPKDKYQLLCANCNQGKKRNKGICPHKAGGYK